MRFHSIIVASVKLITVFIKLLLYGSYCELQRLQNILWTSSASLQAFLIGYPQVLCNHFLFLATNICSDLLEVCRLTLILGLNVKNVFEKPLFRSPGSSIHHFHYFSINMAYFFTNLIHRDDIVYSKFKYKLFQHD